MSTITGDDGDTQNVSGVVGLAAIATTGSGTDLATASVPGSKLVDDSIGAEKLVDGVANIAGKQVALTSGTTPTVALGVDVDWLEITLGADATKLTVTGLNLDVDAGYEFCGTVTPTGAPDMVSIKLNDTDASATISGLYWQSSVLHAYTGSTLQFADAVAGVQTCCAQLRSAGAGVAKYYSVEIKTNVHEKLWGVTGLTANVTLVSFNSVAAGSVINIRRVRPTSA